MVIHLGPPPESGFGRPVAMSPDGRLILSAAAENRAVVHKRDQHPCLL